ncbi:hypothetical protein JZU46_06360 [bacterium]|nr:hypothetical protein [bacterium]
MTGFEWSLLLAGFLIIALVIWGRSIIVKRNKKKKADEDAYLEEKRRIMNDERLKQSVAIKKAALARRTSNRTSPHRHINSHTCCSYDDSFQGFDLGFSPGAIIAEEVLQAAEDYHGGGGRNGGGGSSHTYEKEADSTPDCDSGDPGGD